MGCYGVEAKPSHPQGRERQESRNQHTTVKCMPSEDTDKRVEDARGNRGQRAAACCHGAQCYSLSLRT